MDTPLLRGIYAITDAELLGENAADKVQQAIDGGIALLQYRDKNLESAERVEQALHLFELCQQHKVPFIINDDIELARHIDADGIHLGQQDTPLLEARQQVSKSKLIGISCNNQLVYGIQAQQDGADYVAFGRFFASQTKPDAPQADLQLLSTARELIQLPIVAIGGVTRENGAELIDAGADMLAVVHGIFGQPDIYQATRKLSKLFSDN